MTPLPRANPFHSPWLLLTDGAEVLTLTFVGVSLTFVGGRVCVCQDCVCVCVETEAPLLSGVDLWLPQSTSVMTRTRPELRFVLLPSRATHHQEPWQQWNGMEGTSRVHREETRFDRSRISSFDRSHMAIEITRR